MKIFALIKIIIIHQSLEMTFNKIETSYVAYSQKRAAYDHKGWWLASIGKAGMAGAG